MPRAYTEMELDEVFRDRDWWVSLLPKGWRLVGFTGRERATMRGTDGEHYEISGELIPIFEGRWDWAS